jgi:RHS repeat-associated protein
MGSVTALMMDVITDKSGHTMTGLAVSVCLTPAAPAPLPIPYPTIASTSEGVIDECLRTKIDGGKVLTVGSCTKNCHGNEPGTLKEVVSLNTAGPSFPILGAPIVLIELGMAGITLSPGFMNKNPIPGIGGSASGAGGGGGGGGGAGGGAGGPPGGSTQGPSNGGGGGGGSNSGAAPPNAPAGAAAEGQATASHPVDVVTGTLFTDEVIDFMMPGPLPVHFRRSYATSAALVDVGMGFGWSHSYAWSATVEKGLLRVVGPQNRTFDAPIPAEGEVVVLERKLRLSRTGTDLVLDLGDGVFRILRAASDSSSRSGEGSGGRFQLVELRDSFANVVELTWEAGELTGILDSVGRSAQLRKSGNTRLWEVSVDDEHGQTQRKVYVIYEVDAAGNLVRCADAGGAETRYEYDEEHYLLEEIQPDGLTYHFRHEPQSDGKKRCVESWGELAGKDIFAELGAENPKGARGIFHTQLTYEPDALRTTVNDGLGQVHVYLGNRLGLVERYTDPRGYVRQYHYDEHGNLIAAQDGGGRTERRSFDPFGRRTSVTTHDGRTWRSSYDAEKGVLTETRPDGVRESFQYNRDVLVGQKDSSGGTSELAWGERGGIAEVIRPNGTAFKYEYDAHGNVSKIVQPDGSTFEYTFDLFGCPVRAKTPLGVEYTLKYDSRHDLVAVDESTGRHTDIAISPARRVVARGEPRGTTTFKYAGPAMTETVKPDGRRYKVGYDALLRMRWIENPAGERYERHYDGSGNVSREISFAGLHTSYEHDGSGYLARTERSDGSWTRFERDSDGRILVGEHSGGLVERFTYDAMGKLVRAQNGTSFVSMEHDKDGRVVREVQEAGGYKFEVQRTFDADGHMTERKYGSGWSVAMKRRPEDGKLTSLRAVAKEPQTIAFTYDAKGNETGRRRVEGVGAIAFERNDYGLPTRITLEGKDDEVMRQRAYTWSAIGPVVSIDDDRRGGRKFELDPEGRPIRAEGMGVSEQFAFAPQGTPIPRNDPAFQTGRDGRPVRTGNAALEWDARGRLTRRIGQSPQETWEYRYDDRDRLLSATRADGPAVRYLYDALGRCIASSRGEGDSTWFGWDGDTIVEEQRTDGQRTQRVYADDGFTPLLDAKNGKDWRLVATDGAGTPWAYLHEDLSLSEIDFSTWGKVTRSEGDPGPLRFAGQRADELTGLHYNRHRFYSPELHVFLTPDPLGVATSLQDVGFVKNVTLYIDPLGLVVIVNADPNDPVISASTQRLQAQYPGSRVLQPHELTPGSLNGESHVIVNSHGAPGGITWGNGWANGQQVGESLRNAGFRGGFKSQVDITACNSATPQQGGGPSTAQGVANATGSTVNGAMSNNPQATYAGTTAVGPGGHQWGPGMLGVNGQGPPYVHDGQWTAVKPNTVGGWGRRVWGGVTGH